MRPPHTIHLLQALLLFFGTRLITTVVQASGSDSGDDPNSHRDIEKVEFYDTSTGNLVDTCHHGETITVNRGDYSMKIILEENSSPSNDPKGLKYGTKVNNNGYYSWITNWHCTRWTKRREGSHPNRETFWWSNDSSSTAISELQSLHEGRTLQFKFQSNKWTNCGSYYHVGDLFYCNVNVVEEDNTPGDCDNSGAIIYTTHDMNPPINIDGVVSPGEWVDATVLPMFKSFHPSYDVLTKAFVKVDCNLRDWYVRVMVTEARFVKTSSQYNQHHWVKINGNIVVGPTITNTPTSTHGEFAFVGNQGWEAKFRWTEEMAGEPLETLQVATKVYTSYGVRSSGTPEIDVCLDCTNDEVPSTAPSGIPSAAPTETPSGSPTKQVTPAPVVTEAPVVTQAPANNNGDCDNSGAIIYTTHGNMNPPINIDGIVSPGEWVDATVLPMFKSFHPSYDVLSKAFVKVDCNLQEWYVRVVVTEARFVKTSSQYNQHHWVKINGNIVVGPTITSTPTSTHGEFAFVGNQGWEAKFRWTEEMAGEPLETLQVATKVYTTYGVRSSGTPEIDVCLECTDDEMPSTAPSGSPAAAPSAAPTEAPVDSVAPSVAPTGKASGAPSKTPTAPPTEAGSAAPSATPTGKPSHAPSQTPTALVSSEMPSAPPTGKPSSETPTGLPSAAPTAAPTFVTPAPSVAPTETYATPAPQSTPSPSARPTGKPSETPTGLPSAVPTVARLTTDQPSALPTVWASLEQPSTQPSAQPSPGVPDCPSNNGTLIQSAYNSMHDNPTINGILSPGEWNDATELSMYRNSDPDQVVLSKALVKVDCATQDWYVLVVITYAAEHVVTDPAYYDDHWVEVNGVRVVDGNAGGALTEFAFAGSIGWEAKFRWTDPPAPQTLRIAATVAASYQKKVSATPVMSICVACDQDENAPSLSPSDAPSTSLPSAYPTATPSDSPSVAPTPTRVITQEPSSEPSITLSAEPTKTASSEPTAGDTTMAPTSAPTSNPTTSDSCPGGLVYEVYGFSDEYDAPPIALW